MRYQKIPDALLRSSKLTSDDIRLYGLLLSFAYKSESNPSRAVLAEIMGKSIRTVTYIIRRLEKLDLIKQVDQRDPNKPHKYLIRKGLPKNVCDKNLMGAWGKIADDLHDRRRSEEQELRNGRDNSGIATGCNTPLHQAATPLAASCKTSCNPLQDLLQPTARPPATSDRGSTPDAPVNAGDKSDCEVREKALSIHLATHLEDHLNQTTFEGKSRPLGALARREGAVPGAPAHPEETDKALRSKTEDEKVRCLVVPKLHTSGKSNGDGYIAESENSPVSLEEDDPMAETEDQRKARLERAKKLRQGTRTRFNPTKDITDEGKGRVSSMAGMTAEDRDRAKHRRKDAAEAAREAPIPDPETVDEVPGRPHGLIKHFTQVLMKHSPDARYRPLKKDYAWAKELLKQFNRQELYEMIQLLVFDWINARDVAGLWPKPGPGDYPNIKYLYFWSQTLINHIDGQGLAGEATHRVSYYATDWRRRRGEDVDVTEDPTADELRERLRRNIED